MNSKAIVTCKNCGEKLPDEWIQSSSKNMCPKCGSLLQKIELSIEDTLPPMHDSLNGKVKDNNFTGKRKVRQEFFVGDDLRKSDGKFVKKERYIDRDNDSYKETVVDPENNKVIHHCEEKLSEHIGHGSDKKKILTSRCT